MKVNGIVFVTLGMLMAAGCGEIADPVVESSRRSDRRTVDARGP